MTLAEARKMFTEHIYKLLTKEQKRDTILVNLEYSFFIDSLCKNGEITQGQYDRAGCYRVKRRKSK